MAIPSVAAEQESLLVSDEAIGNAVNPTTGSLCYSESYERSTR